MDSCVGGGDVRICFDFDEHGRIDQSPDFHHGGRGADRAKHIAVRTPDFETKAARLAEIDACFDIPHFAKYTGVLVLLDAVSVDELSELVEESWLTVAPKRAAKAWLAERA